MKVWGVNLNIIIKGMYIENFVILLNIKDNKWMKRYLVFINCKYWYGYYLFIIKMK